MDRFTALEAFVRVMDAGGFSQAARARGVAPSSLTRQIDGLEQTLGTKLLRRSTRAVIPTEAGAIYYTRARRVLDELQAADAAVAGYDATPHGLLRISVPVVFGRLYVTPLLTGFLKACPAVHLEVSFSDTVIDLAVADIDVAIRLGGVGSSDLIARRLAPQRRILCASPAYLIAHGEPNVPADLAGHSCLLFAYRPGPLRWRFDGPEGLQDIEVSGPLRTNNSDALREAAIASLGLILMPDWLVAADLAEGKLVEVMKLYPPNQTAGAGVHAVWLPNRRGAPKVRAFVAYLAEHMAFAA